MQRDVINEYKALSAEQRALVGLVAVAEGAVYAYALESVYAAYRGWGGGHRAFLKLRSGLIAAGWLREASYYGSSYTDMDPDLRESLVRWLIAEGGFLALSEVWLKSRAVNDNSRSAFYRRMRDALLRGDEDRFLELHDDTGYSVVPWLIEPLEEALIKRQAPTVQAVLLEQILDYVALRAVAVPGLYELIEEQIEADPDPSLLMTWATLCLTRGDVEQAQEALETFLEADFTRGLLGWLQLMRGDLKGAANHYVKALAYVRESYYDQDPFIEHSAGPWLPLAYFLRGLKSRREQGLRLLKVWSAKAPVDSAYKSLPALEQVADPSNPPVRTDSRHPAGVLLEALAGRWGGKPVPSARLEAARALALELDWRWIAAELEAVRTGEPSSLEGVVALHTHRAKHLAWEVHLNRLEAVLNGESSQAAKRLVWTLSPEPFQLLAREQSRSKRGWSKGRRVSFSSLLSKSKPLPSITAADRSLLVHLKQREVQDWYHRRSLVYEWNEEGAWRALCGHPRVFDEQGRPLVIRRATPRLVVTENSRSVTLSLDPPIIAGQSLLQVDETTWEVYWLDEARVDIGRVLGKRGIKIPKKQGEKRLAALLGRLAQHFDVHDETQLSSTAGPTREVQGQPVPILQLRPEGEGFMVRLLVRPLGGGGAELSPGEGAVAIISRQPEGAVVVRRDLAEEKRRADAVLAAAPILQAALWEEQAWHLPQPEDALILLEQLHDLGDAVVVEWPEGEELRLRAKLSTKSLSISVTSADQWLSASGKLQVDENLVLGLSEILAALDASPGRFVTLDDGSLLALSAKLRRHLERLSRASTSKGDKVQVHRLAAPLLQPLVEGAGKRRTDKGYKEQLRAALAPVAAVEVPRGLQAELRPYQVEGFQWLCRMAALGAGACLADDMGLGKTVQALALLLHRAAEGPALVIAPTSVCAGWEQEAWRFAPSLQVHSLHHGDRAATLAQLGPGHVLIASYGLLLSEAEALTGIHWSTVVLDEAQAIKNPSTRRHKNALALDAGMRIALSGTPIENHLGELWALFRFLNPGFLGSWERYRARFVLPMEEGDREVGRQLRDLVRPFVLRRTKAAVLHELPARTDITLRVELEAKEAAHYELVRRQAIEALSRDDSPSPMTVLAQLTRLRLAACHPSLVGSPLGESAKLKAFGRLVEDLREGGHRALVFSQFVKHLAILRDWLDEHEIAYLYLDGSTPARQRKQRVEAFQQGTGDLFLISLKAGGLGLNLTAADYVIHMDPWWNPAVEDQAADRAHRIGQTRPVTVYRLVASGTVEERIVDLHARKRDLADQLLEGADAAARMGVEELVSVLRGEV